MAAVSAHPLRPRLLSKILSECEDADEIEYLVDGSWCPIRAEKEQSCSPQGPILVLGESQARACCVLGTALKHAGKACFSSHFVGHSILSACLHPCCPQAPQMQAGPCLPPV